jgi:glutamate synthase (NADPH) small chain
VIHDGYVAHDAAMTAAAEGAEVTLTSLFTRDKMTASEHEVHDALHEGVTILDGVMPLEVMLGENGRATGLGRRLQMVDGRPTPVEGTERILAADLIVAAIGQGGDLTGLEELDNGRGLMNADKFYQVPNKPGHFVAGDIIRPHLLTTAIGQASIAVDSIDEYVRQVEHKRRPKVDVHHFNLLEKMTEANLAPEAFVPESAATCAEPRVQLCDPQLRGSLGRRGHPARRALPRPLQLPSPAICARKRCRAPRTCSATSRNA